MASPSTRSPRSENWDSLHTPSSPSLLPTASWSVGLTDATSVPSPIPLILPPQMAASLHGSVPRFLLLLLLHLISKWSPWTGGLIFSDQLHPHGHQTETSKICISSCDIPPAPNSTQLHGSCYIFCYVVSIFPSGIYFRIQSVVEVAVSLGRASKDSKLSGTSFKEAWAARGSRVKRTCPRICQSQLSWSFHSSLAEFSGDDTKQKTLVMFWVLFTLVLWKEYGFGSQIDLWVWIPALLLLVLGPWMSHFTPTETLLLNCEMRTKPASWDWCKQLIRYCS